MEDSTPRMRPNTPMFKPLGNGLISSRIAVPFDYIDKKTNNMNHLFVSYAVAQKLKEKGFDQDCLAYYNPKNEFILGLSKPRTDDKYDCISCPMHQQVIDFFRAKHNIIIEIQCDKTTYPKFCYEVYKYEDFAQWERKTNIDNWGLYLKYYEAMDKAIETALTLI